MAGMSQIRIPGPNTCILGNYMVTRQ